MRNALWTGNCGINFFSGTWRRAATDMFAIAAEWNAAVGVLIPPVRVRYCRQKAVHCYTF
jgi:hypothetical protein